MQSFHYITIDSTQEEAKRLIRSGAITKNSAYVISETQTQGRGQHGKHWASPQGAGIYLSVIAKKNKLVLDDFAQQYTQLVAEKIILVLKEFFDYDFYVKPINDIYYDGSKLAGILVEVIEHNQQSYVITGVGLNIKKTILQIKESLIETPKAPPISLEEILTNEELSSLDQDLLLKKLMDYISLTEA